MKPNFKSTFQLIPISIFLMLIVSCKSNKVITEGTVNDKLSAKVIIKTHYQNQIDFKTIRGKMKIDYSDGESSRGVSVSLRMEKDKARMNILMVISHI